MIVLFCKSMCTVLGVAIALRQGGRVPSRFLDDDTFGVTC